MQLAVGFHSVVSGVILLPIQMKKHPLRLVSLPGSYNAKHSSVHNESFRFPNALKAKRHLCWCSSSVLPYINKSSIRPTTDYVRVTHLLFLKLEVKCCILQIFAHLALHKGAVQIVANPPVSRLASMPCPSYQECTHSRSFACQMAGGWGKMPQRFRPVAF